MAALLPCCPVPITLQPSNSRTTSAPWHKLMPGHRSAQHALNVLTRARLPCRSPITRQSAKRRHISTQIKESPSTKAKLSKSQRHQAFPWVITSLMAGGIAFYTAAVLVTASKPCQKPEIIDLALQKDVSGRYDETADSFDSQVAFEELRLGIKRMRKQLAQQCTGHVLEVSCGTGRNLGYYDISDSKSLIDSLTFVDLSPQMVAVCKKKFNVLFGTASGSLDSSRLKPGLVVRFLSASALDVMPPAPGGKDKKYDTIIQTMGLCSTPSPQQLLLNMVRHLNTANPEARILLLEHGRGSWSWVNNILDNSAAKHAEKHGCWYNRDIDAIVEEAAKQTGMEILKAERYRFGTTWVFELRPSTELARKSELAIEAKHTAKEDIPNSSWKKWLGLG